MSDAAILAGIYAKALLYRNPHLNRPSLPGKGAHNHLSVRQRDPYRPTGPASTTAGPRAFSDLPSIQRYWRSTHARDWGLAPGLVRPVSWRRRGAAGQGAAGSALGTTRSRRGRASALGQGAYISPAQQPGLSQRTRGSAPGNRLSGPTARVASRYSGARAWSDGPRRGPGQPPGQPPRGAEGEGCCRCSTRRQPMR